MKAGHSCRKSGTFLHDVTSQISAPLVKYFAYIYGVKLYGECANGVTQQQGLEILLRAKKRV
jgi:hypothetical protein